MGLTRDYLKFLPFGTCNLVGSPNGAVCFVDSLTCAVAAAESVVLYNMRTLEKTNEIRRDSSSHPVTAFALGKNLSILAIGYADGECHLHMRPQQQTAEAPPPVVFAGHRTGVNCIAFSQDDFTLATGGKDSVIVLWDILNESGICRLRGHKGTITHLQFVSQAGQQFIVSSSKDAQIRFWSLASRSCFYTLAESPTEIYSFALVDSDRLLLVGSAEIELLVYELDWIGQGREEEEELHWSAGMAGTGAEQQQQANTILLCRKRGSLMRQAKGRALQLSVSRDGSLVGCVGADSLMDVYRLFTEEESRRRFQKKLRKMRKSLAEPAEEESAARKLEAEVRQDVTTKIARIGDFRADSKIKWVDWCQLTTSAGPSEGESGKVREYRFFCLLKTNDVQGISMGVDWKSSGTTCAVLASLGQLVHRTDVRSLAFSSDGKFFVSGSNECAIVWDVYSLLPLNKLTADGLAQISGALVLAGDRKVVLGTKIGSLFLFDLKSCELLGKHELVHEQGITEMCAFPRQAGFLSCGHDKKCRFWDIEEGQGGSGTGREDASSSTSHIRSRRVLELPDEPLCAALSPDGRFLALGLLDNNARVYFTDSLKLFTVLYGHSLPIYSIHISPDSKLVVTGSGDKSVKIWGLDFGDCHRSLFAHDDAVSCVRFSPAGNSEEAAGESLFWSAGRDGKLKQWDAHKFQHIQTLEGHADRVESMALSPDGNTLVSSSRDKSIRLWELSEELVVLQEEEERQRELELEQRLVDEEDIVPGERRTEAEGDGADLAALKSSESVKSTERLMDALEVLRAEAASRAEDPAHKRHVLLAQYQLGSEHFFILDTLQRIRASHLEKSLLALPFAYVPELLEQMCQCVRHSYKLEIASRVVNFLIRVHHNQLVHSIHLLPIVNELRTVLPAKIGQSLDRTGFNIAGLRFLQFQLERVRDGAKLFDLEAVEADRQLGAKKRRKRGKKQGN